MNTEAPARAISPSAASPFLVFTTSLCAAICVAGGFGIVFEAFVISVAGQFGLGHTFVLAASGVVALGTLWLAVWSFARSWHVERRLRQGLEVDEPKLSILANFRGE
jgi:hypothetical protein